MSRPKWHLSFDCATKTFAFSLSYVNFDAYHCSKSRIHTSISAVKILMERAKEAINIKNIPLLKKIVNELDPILTALDQETKNFIQIKDGEMIDLFPGRDDDSIYSIERIRGVVNYVEKRIKPCILKEFPPAEKLRIVIEFQMGYNSKARAVANALITLFSKDDIIIVGPSLKNKISASSDGKYCYFAERYKSSYYANKAHAKYNFAKIEEVFGSNVPKSKKESDRGHIADSFMQVIGYIVHGCNEDSIMLCF